MKLWKALLVFTLGLWITHPLAAGESSSAGDTRSVISGSDYTYRETGKFGEFKFIGAQMGLALLGSPETSFVPSVRFMYFPKNCLGFIIEVDYKAASYDPDGALVEEKAHYIDIIALFSVKLQSFFIGVGPYLGILVSSSLTPVPPADNTYIQSRGMKYNKVLTGALFSFGFVSTNAIKFLIAVDIGIGFNSIGNNVSNNASQFSLMLKLGVGF